MFQISYSALETYKECPKKYFFNKIRKIRPEKVGSPLVFGSAIDDGLNELLLTKDLDKAKESFLKSWITCIINDKPVKLHSSTKIKYSKNDLDSSFLTEEEKTHLNGDYFNDGWVCLKYKGFLMLEAYRDQILPRIKKVIEVQKKVKLKNKEKDVFNGVIDLICEWEDGRVVVFDNKTSSVKYKEDSVKTSTQLATYVYSMRKEYPEFYAGYIVVPKRILKREPKCTISVIIDQIPQTFINETFSLHNESLFGIKDGEFPRNTTSCKSKYGLCDYYNLCHNKDLKGLEDLKKR